MKLAIGVCYSETTIWDSIVIRSTAVSVGYLPTPLCTYDSLPSDATILTVFSQQCYNQPNCAGDVIPGQTTAKECCVGTDDGMSFAWS